MTRASALALRPASSVQVKSKAPLRLLHSLRSQAKLLRGIKTGLPALLARRQNIALSETMSLQRVFL